MKRTRMRLKLEESASGIKEKRVLSLELGDLDSRSLSSTTY